MDGAWPEWFEGLGFALRGRDSSPIPSVALDVEPLGPGGFDAPEPISTPLELAPGVSFEEDE